MDFAPEEDLPPAGGPGLESNETRPVQGKVS
jgi:hypothetical protein